MAAEEKKTKFFKVVSVLKRTGYAGALSICKLEKIETAADEDEKAPTRYYKKIIKGSVAEGDVIEFK